MTKNELKKHLSDSIRLLSIPGVGRTRFNKLVNRFGSPQKVLSASIDDLRQVPDIGQTTADSIANGNDTLNANKISAEIIQLGWNVLFPKFDDYPKTLKQIDNYPPLLFYNGKSIDDSLPKVAIVGTRHASEENSRFTYQIAAELARNGITIVSGMAEGIDSAAHKGALSVNGETIAVWGTSLDIIYPPGNKSLAEEIKEKGTILSEYLPNTKPDKSTFPERNRIISGLSDAVLVVEAGERSGALITANYALEQGRELMAIPGAPNSLRSIGSNNLIKKGAALITSVDDIFNALPRLKSTTKAKKASDHTNMTVMEKKMVSFLQDGPQQIDQLSRLADISVGDTMGFMLALEMKGVVQEISGKRFVLAD